MKRGGTRCLLLAWSGAAALAAAGPGAAQDASSPAAPSPPAVGDASKLSTAQRIVAGSYLLGACEAHMDLARIEALEAKGDAVPMTGPAGAATMGQSMREARAAGAKAAKTKPPLSAEQCRRLAGKALELLGPPP